MRYRWFFWLSPLLLGCNSVEEKTPAGKVVSIADGDTFTYLDEANQQVKVRLHGIDAPERGQDFGKVSRQKLSDLLFNQPVKLEIMDTDRYGRTVAIVFNEAGVCINEEMLKAGLAWHYKVYDDNAAWARLEKEAKRQKKGLWSQPRPTPPWDYRKAQRSPTKKAA